MRSPSREATESAASKTKPALFLIGFSSVSLLIASSGPRQDYSVARCPLDGAAAIFVVALMRDADSDSVLPWQVGAGRARRHSGRLANTSSKDLRSLRK